MKLQNINKNKNGFTLLELLIFMGIFSVILVSLTTLFSTIVSQQFENQSFSAAESDKTYILSKLAYDFSEAESVVAPTSNGETSQTLTIMVDGVNNTYSVEDGNLVLNISGESYVLNSSRTKISSISFKRLGEISGKPTIKIVVEMEGVASDLNKTEINTVFAIK